MRPQQRAVRVRDEPRTLTVYQKAESIWVAVGYYLDEWIEIEAATEADVVKKWAEAAETKGSSQDQQI